MTSAEKENNKPDSLMQQLKDESDMANKSRLEAETVSREHERAMESLRL